MSFFVRNFGSICLCFILDFIYLSLASCPATLAAASVVSLTQRSVDWVCEGNGGTSSGQSTIFFIPDADMPAVKQGSVTSI